MKLLQGKFQITNSSNQKGMEIGNWKMENGNWKLENGNWLKIEN